MIANVFGAVPGSADASAVAVEGGGSGRERGVEEGKGLRLRRVVGRREGLIWMILGSETLIDEEGNGKV